MRERYEVKDNKLVYGIWDNLDAKFVMFQVEDTKVLHSLYEDTAIKACSKMNTEHRQLEKSIAVMKAANIKGQGVNLCNEFNFIDLWEVVEWIAQQDTQVNVNDSTLSMSIAFGRWFDNADLWSMKQREMQCAIVDKVYELLKDAGMVV